MFENLKTYQVSKKRNQSAGFTLVELLLVIAIIAVLSGMALGVMAKAQDEAKSSATEARILMIENLFAILIEDYEVRRLPISIRELGRYADQNPIQVDGNGNITNKLHQVRNLRRRIQQDIVNAENPRPLLTNNQDLVANPDVGVFPTTIGPFGSAVPGGFLGWLQQNYPNPQFSGGHDSSTNPYLWERLAQVTPSLVQSYGPMKIGAATDPDFDLPGEYVYAILERMDVDGAPATELLGSSTIGNTDEDGYPEVVDAWGEPMLLRIWQIETTPPTNDTSVSNDAYSDVANIDFDSLNGTGGAPTGYIGLDSSIPRGLHKVRFEVVSTRLGRNHY